MVIQRSIALCIIQEIQLRFPRQQEHNSGRVHRPCFLVHKGLTLTPSHVGDNAIWQTYTRYWKLNWVLLKPALPDLNLFFNSWL